MQKLPQDYLTLRLVRLQADEEWNQYGDGYTFILPKAGKARYTFGSNVWNVFPGDVLVVNQAAGGKLTAQKGEVIFWSFSVCVDHLFPLFSASEVSLLQDITHEFRTSKIYLAATAAAQECHRLLDGAPPQGNLDHRSQALRIAAAILSIEFLTARKQRHGVMRVEDHMMQVFDELSATEVVTLSVGELAGKFGCSRRHLNRLFHQNFGFSVASLRMELRLLKAVSLLRDPNAKIISVAEQCGFNHLGLFNTCFKRRFGNSPGQWRKTGRSASEIPAPTEAVSDDDAELAAKSRNDSPGSNVVQAKIYQILRGINLDGPAADKSSVTPNRGRELSARSRTMA